LEELVAADNAAGLNTRALLVAQGGEIKAEAYAQNADPQTPLLGWSMAKSLISVMLGNLEMRGLIDLRGPAGFDQWANDKRAEILISDLLTMTDGLDFSETYNPGDDATSMLFTSPSASDYTLAKPLAFEPGTHFNYSSGTANILARLYGDALGSAQAAYDDYVAEIAEPLGMSNAVFEMDASGVFFGSSYFYASARDWARLGQLMLNQGAINGRRIVTPEWIQRATSPNGSTNGPAYGYQWWLNDGAAQLRWPSLPADAFAANGNRQQVVMVIPSASTVIVRLGWTAGSYPVDTHFKQILSAL
jgi:CubicO group peptidase (beta-lactamase class C family)